MLYNDGSNLKKIFYKSPVGSIYLAGKKIYPYNLDGITGTDGVLAETTEDHSIWEYKLTFDDHWVGQIKWENSLPLNSDIIDIADLSELYVIHSINDTAYDPISVTPIPDYDDNSTYSIGDVVIHPYSTIFPHIATCIEDISTPEPFNSNKWVREKYYKHLLGKYDSNSTYSVGDVVVYDNKIYTCTFNIDVPEIWTDNHWTHNYYPKLRLFIPNHNYSIGDVVWGISGAISNAWTCKIPHTSTDTFDSTKFINGYYPELLGDWDETVTYSRGDVVLYNNSLYTYFWQYSLFGKLPTDSRYWKKLYAPLYKYAKTIEYDYSVQYEVGDIIGENNRIICYPNIPYNIRSPKIFAWIDNEVNSAGFNVLHLYCESSTILANHRLKISYGSSQQPYVNNFVTDISGLSHIDTTNTFDFQYCFERFGNLRDLSPIVNWNTVNAHSFERFFTHCVNLSDLSPIANWDTSSVSTMHSMFVHCDRLQTLSGLDNWNTRKLQNTMQMFYACYGLNDISALSKWEMQSVTTMKSMFYSCTSLTTLSGLDHIAPKFSCSMESMFERCTSLSDISALNTADLSHVSSTKNMFYGCTSLTELENIHWDLGNDTDLSDMFYNCPIVTLRELYWTNLRNFPTFENCQGLVKADFSRCTLSPLIAGITTTDLFRGSSDVEECDLGTVFGAFGMRIWSSSGGPFTSCSKLRLLIIRRTSSVISRAYYVYEGYGDGLGYLVNNHGTVYVPQSMIDAYQNDPDWATLFNSGVALLPLEGSLYEYPGSL